MSLFGLGQSSFSRPEMRPRDVLSFCLLSLVIHGLVVPRGSSSGSPSCRQDERDYLLQLKNSFSISGPPPALSFTGFLCLNTSYPKTLSWRESEDCCSWDGITCDVQSGVVIGLDLSCSLLSGTINSNSSLFSLRHLRNLSLAGNYLLGSRILPEVSIFAEMMYLNLSSSGFSGRVPAEISRMSKLVTLDLSKNCIDLSCLELQRPTMSALVRNLTFLKELDLTNVNMSAVIPSSMANFTSYLTSLKLGGCLLQGKLPDNIFQLPNLHTLDLSDNGFVSGILPKSNWSSGLISLSLGSTSFTGEIPRSIGNLSRLAMLDLSWTRFTGYVDIKQFSKLENLRVLELSGTSVSGVYAMDENHNFQKLEELHIVDGRLINFPCFMSSMPELRELRLDLSIVTEVSSRCDSTSLMFPRLEELNMAGCNFTGSLSFLSHSKGLRTIDLSQNMVKVIPHWFWGIGIDTLEFLSLDSNLAEGNVRLPWRKLRYLNLHNNSFEGPLPVPSRSIQTFYASLNHFNGSIPPQICELPSLLWLSFAQSNLTGIIPQCLGNITGLEFVNLSNNSLTGPLPRSLANCTSLQIIDISYNNIIDTPPVWLAAATELSLQSNDFKGTWPTDFFLNKSLRTLDLSNNRFEGSPPCPSHTTIYYMISNNNFSGEISSCVCKAGNLSFLDMSNNGLTGNLPECLKNITINLVYMGLQNNRLGGAIPEICSNESSWSSNMRGLDFSRNEFEGLLPRSLLNCPQLEFLDVSNNMISDSFPDWLRGLPILKVLNLRSNKFHGGVSISKGDRPFSALSILDLSENSLDGDLTDALIVKIAGMMRAEDIHLDSTYMGSGLRRRDRGFPFRESTLGVNYYQQFYSVVINLKGVKREMLKINVARNS